MASYADLYIDQGADFSAALLVTNADRTPLNMTGYTVQSAMRRGPLSLSSVPFAVTLTAPTAGAVTLSLPHTTTAQLFPTRWVYDVMMTDTTGKITKIYHGMVFVNPGATNVSTSIIRE